MLFLTIIIAVTPASAQEQEGQKQGHNSASSLFIALLANGDALVEHNVGIEDPLAEQTRIKLFGDDINDLIVVDYEDNPVEFKRGETSNEIVLSRPNASNLKISYTTSDFLSKDRREWIFSLNSTISVSVKLPPDSILTDPGENPSIVLVGDQQTPYIQTWQYTVRLCNRNIRHTRASKHCHKSSRNHYCSVK